MPSGALVTLLAVPVLEVIADPLFVATTCAEATLSEIEKILGRRGANSEVPILALFAEFAGLGLALEESADSELSIRPLDVLELAHLVAPRKRASAVQPSDDG